MGDIVIERSGNGTRMQSDVENGIMYAVVHVSGKQQHSLMFKGTVLYHEEGSRRP